MINKKYITIVAIALLNICGYTLGKNKNISPSPYSEMREMVEYFKSYPDSVYNKPNAIIFPAQGWDIVVLKESDQRQYLNIKCDTESDFSINTWMDKDSVNLRNVTNATPQTLETTLINDDRINFISLYSVLLHVYYDSISPSESVILYDVPDLDLYWGGSILSKSGKRFYVELNQDLAQGYPAQTRITGWIDKGSVMVHPPHTGINYPAGPGNFLLYNQPNTESDSQSFTGVKVENEELRILDYTPDNKWLFVEFNYEEIPTPVTGWINLWCDSVWSCGN